MSPNILRSVVKQVNVGGRSVVSCRTLSTRPRRKFSSSQVAEFEGSYADLFATSLLLGFSVVGGWEFIQMLEYCRTMQRSLNEHAGRVSNSPMRDFLLELWRDLRR